MGLSFGDNSKPRIAFFAREFIGRGAEKVALNLCKEFINQGLEVDLVLENAAGQLLNQVPEKVGVVNFNILPVKKFSKFGIPSYFQSVRSVFPLVRYLRSRKPDALISFSHFCNEAAIVAKYLSGARTKIILSEHINISFYSRHEKRGLNFLLPFLDRLLYPLADFIITVSRGVKEGLIRKAGLKSDKVKFIYNPIVDDNLFGKSRQHQVHPWFLPSQPPVIIGLGSLSKQKDFPMLIRAFSLVRKNRPCRLLIIGEGDERNSLNKLIKELGLEKDATLLGFLPNPYPFMSKAAVFALSSIFEGLSNVLIEAMALGIPVISTDCPSGPAEILDNGKYGYLVPVGDEKAMAEAILKVLEGNAKKADPAWLKQFTVEYAAEKYLEVIRGTTKNE